MNKVLRLAAAAESHEEIFMARYERLRKWALHLSANDQAQAEDLIQEAFIQFTLTNADLESIRNFDAYLFGLLRILHLSQLRRSKNRAQLLRMILDYDAAVLGLRAADPRGQIIMREQLQRVCQYACARKETSKAGSVLLLRFFLGYYPAEISRVSGCSRPAVEERLRIARAEAKAFLDDPDFLGGVGGAAPAPSARCDLTQPVDAFLRDLRRRIYQSRGGVCLTARQWESLYAGGGAVDCATLSHLASCPGCLDAVNKLLGLPLLEERHPIDALGKDTRGKDGGDGGGPGGGAGAGGDDFEARRCRQRAREVLEHSPQELCVAVNGRVFGSQRVGGPHSEQTLNITESVDFVEVFSEQDVRLLLLHVGEPPPDGPFRHAASINLHNGRRLEASLSLNYPSSSLRVIYRDPVWQTWAAPGVDEEDEQAGADATTSNAETRLGPGRRGATWGFAGRRLEGGWERLRRLFTSYRWWLRPGPAAAVLSLLLIAALLFVRWGGGTASAAELLGRSAAAERARDDDRASVINRVFQLVQTGKSAGEPTLRRRVEIWQSAERAVTVRRVYDDRDRLVIAERVGADGTRTVFSPGARPSTSAEARPRPFELLEAGALWRLTPSAEVFLDLAGPSAAARVEEGPGTFTISHRAADTRSPGGVLEVSLVIRKADLRGVELRIVAEREGRVREYRFIESQFTRQPAGDAPPSVFEVEGAWPDAPHVNPAPSTADRAAAAAPPTLAPSLPNADPVTASAELEVEVNYLLHRVRASLGEQIGVRRTPDGRLRVEAVAETAERRSEILKALAPVAGNPAVGIEVSTVAEALRRRAGVQAAPTSVFEVEVRDDAPDVDAELSSHFAPRLGDDARAGGAVLRLSNRVINHSRRAVQHAAALKRLTGSFSLQKSGSLDAGAREKLLTMIRAHAQGYGQSVQALRRELLPLSPGGGSGPGPSAVTSDAELAGAAERLLRLSHSNDEAVRSAFALSAQGQTLGAVKSPRFWASLGAAETLSRAISQAYR